MKIISLSVELDKHLSPLVKNDSGITIIDLAPKSTGETVANPSGQVTVDPSVNVVNVYPEEPYNAIGSAVINPVTSAIDPDIKPENILSGVEILGVTGTAHPFSEYPFSAIGYTSSESAHAYMAYLQTFGSEEGIEEAIFDASTVYSQYASYDRDLMPVAAYEEAVAASKELVFMPRFNPALGSDVAYEGMFSQHKAVFIPSVWIRMPAEHQHHLTGMFQGNMAAVYIEAVNLSQSNASDLNATNMFEGCERLIKIYSAYEGSIFMTDKIVNCTAIFANCPEIVFPDTITWNGATTLQSAFLLAANNSVDKFPSALSLTANSCTNFRETFRRLVMKNYHIIVKSEAPVETMQNMFRELNNISGQTGNYTDINLNFSLAPGCNCNQAFCFAKVGNIFIRDALYNAGDTGEMFYDTAFNPKPEGQAQGYLYSENNGGLDLSTSTNLYNVLMNTYGLIHLHGLGAITSSVNLRNSPILELQSAEMILEQLGDAEPGATLTFNSAVYAQIPESYIQSATAKGWIVASA